MRPRIAELLDKLEKAANKLIEAELADPPREEKDNSQNTVNFIDKIQNTT